MIAILEPENLSSTLAKINSLLDLVLAPEKDEKSLTLPSQIVAWSW